MKTYYIESLGCAKNLVDSEVFAFILDKHGYRQSDQIEGTDLVLVNTCSFLQESLAELDEVLAWISNYKNDEEIGALVVTGCVMNRAKEDFEFLFPEVDAWIGLKDFNAFEQLLSDQPTGEFHRKALDDKPYAYLRISDGCNNHCTYCMIPSIRGELRSVPMDELLTEARELTTRGIRELVVIAQDTCSYGNDLTGKKMLPELLTRLHEIKELDWIRVMYLHPDNFEMEWLQLFSDLPKLLPYFEMPIQHCNDTILKAMNRRKGRSELKAMFDEIMDKIPNAVLRTTLITAFPGEKAAMHKELLAFIKEVPFMHLGTFEYSAEPGSVAFEMKSQVSLATSEKRSNELMTLHRQVSESLLHKYIGSLQTVLIDEVVEVEDSAEDEIFYVGRAWFQAPEIDGIIEVRGGSLQVGDMAIVSIDDVIDIDLFGTFVRMLPKHDAKGS